MSGRGREGEAVDSSSKRTNSVEKVQSPIMSGRQQEGYLSPLLPPFLCGKEGEPFFH